MEQTPDPDISCNRCAKISPDIPDRTDCQGLGIQVEGLFHILYTVFCTCIFVASEF